MSEELANKAEKRSSLLEQHAQSVLLVIISSALIYSGSFVVSAKEDAARVSAQLSTLTTEVAAMRAQMGVMQSSYINRDDFRDHESRLRHLEQRRVVP